MTTTEPKPATESAAAVPPHRKLVWWAAGAVVATSVAITGAFLWHNPAPAVAAAVRSPRYPGSTPGSRTPDRLRVLFIGNSFTQYNSGLANIMTQLAASGKKTPSPVFDQYTVWGTTWERLWRDSSAPNAIAEGNWDFVVLQDYSIAGLIYRDEMDEYGEIFANAVRKVGARPVFFMTWARLDEEPTQKVITMAYDDVGKSNHAAVAPVGLAFERVRADHPEISLVNTGDKKHPTDAGSYLAACVFYSLFYHESPAGLTPKITDGTKTAIDLPPGVVGYLQRVAWQTVLDFGPGPATTGTVVGGPAVGRFAVGGPAVGGPAVDGTAVGK